MLIGSTIRRKMLNSLPPSTRAAWMTESGMVSKKPLKRRKLKALKRRRQDDRPRRIPDAHGRERGLCARYQRHLRQGERPVSRQQVARDQGQGRRHHQGADEEEERPAGDRATLQLAVCVGRERGHGDAEQKGKRRDERRVEEEHIEWPFEECQSGRVTAVGEIDDELPGRQRRLPGKPGGWKASAPPRRFSDW